MATAIARSPWMSARWADPGREGADASPTVRVVHPAVLVMMTHGAQGPYEPPLEACDRECTNHHTTSEERGQPQHAVPASRFEIIVQPGNFVPGALQ
ncbi:hypothetical protein GCM10022223_40690 [Kineosporia mesophila]|uniref:Uncharacterized protein n=1 Tax=Kineosporia mesophila TaxID=566012 RepID=A0ABP6ZZZ9_9ACTN